MVLELGLYIVSDLALIYARYRDIYYLQLAISATGLSKEYSALKRLSLIGHSAFKRSSLTLSLKRSIAKLYITIRLRPAKGSLPPLI